MSKKINRHLRAENADLRSEIEWRDAQIQDLRSEVDRLRNDANEAEYNCQVERRSDAKKAERQRFMEQQRHEEDMANEKAAQRRRDQKREDDERWRRITGQRWP